jgi:formylglycine-generating enzyme
VNAAFAAPFRGRYRGGALLLGVLCVFLRPPDTRAADRAPLALVPWPLHTRPEPRAPSGGLALLRSEGARMLRVPSSEFFMGSSPLDVIESAALCASEPIGRRCSEQTFANEVARHRVRLSSYYLDRTEVTVGAYDDCVRLARCPALPYDVGARRFDQPDFPASLITWDEAKNYCAFRGARLPTEAEFERAARGAGARRFPWGDLPNLHRANHGRLGIDTSDAVDGFAGLAPVGSYASGRTPEGFLDLAGNASEWVQDRYRDRYPEAAAVDPQGPDATNGSGERVVRGGDFTTPLPWLRGAARTGADPDTRRPALGFRCARSQRGGEP